MSGGQSNLPVRPSEPCHMKNGERRCKNKPRAGTGGQKEGGCGAEGLRGRPLASQVGSSGTGSAQLGGSALEKQAEAPGSCKGARSSASFCRPSHQPLRQQEPHYPTLRHPPAALGSTSECCG